MIDENIIFSKHIIFNEFYIHGSMSNSTYEQLEEIETIMKL